MLSFIFHLVLYEYVLLFYLEKYNNENINEVAILFMTQMFLLPIASNCLY